MRAAALLALLVLSCAAARAMTVIYQCTGHRTMTAEFTPRVAQVHFEGQDYAMRRVADSREATYVDGRRGATVVMRQRELALHLPHEALSCSLQSAALPPPAGPSSP